MEKYYHLRPQSNYIHSNIGNIQYLARDSQFNYRIIGHRCFVHQWHLDRVVARNPKHPISGYSADSKERSTGAFLFNTDFLASRTIARSIIYCRIQSPTLLRRHFASSAFGRARSVLLLGCCYGYNFSRFCRSACNIYKISSPNSLLAVNMSSISLENVSVNFTVYDAHHRSIRNSLIGATTGGRIGADSRERVMIQALPASM